MITVNNKTVEQVMQELAEPFAPDDIEWRVGSTNREKTKGIALAYVTNRAIMNRLDEVVGAFNWQNNFQEWKGTSQLCGIGIRFGEEWVWKWDGADDSNMDAVKGGLSDSMKRAGYQWGIGRYLYNLDGTWTEIEPAGKSYRLKTIPKLPTWALPKGYKANSNAEQVASNQAPKEQPKTQQNSDRKPMSEQQKRRFAVVKALRDGGLDDKKANEWIEKQKAAGKTYDDMIKIIKAAAATKGEKK